MDDSSWVTIIDRVADLHCEVNSLLLLDLLVFLFSNELLYFAASAVLHHDADLFLCQERVFDAHNVGMLEVVQNADLIEHSVDIFCGVQAVDVNELYRHFLFRLFMSVQLDSSKASFAEVPDKLIDC